MIGVLKTGNSHGGTRRQVANTRKEKEDIYKQPGRGMGTVETDSYGNAGRAISFIACIRNS